MFLCHSLCIKSLLNKNFAVFVCTFFVEQNIRKYPLSTVRRDIDEMTKVKKEDTEKVKIKLGPGRNASTKALKNRMEKEFPYFFRTMQIIDK